MQNMFRLSQRKMMRLTDVGQFVIWLLSWSLLAAAFTSLAIAMIIFRVIGFSDATTNMFGSVMAVSGILIWLLAYMTRHFVEAPPQSTITVGRVANFLRHAGAILTSILFLQRNGGSRI
jgi:hypothetical protein